MFFRKNVAVLVTLFFTLILSFQLIITVQAAHFFTPENKDGIVKITEPVDNAYISGDLVNIDALIKKDVLVFGSEININKSVLRSVFAIGNKVNLKLSEESIVGGSVRVVGNEIILSGNFAEDVLILGNKVRFENARIKGNIYISGNNLEIINSRILGDANLSVATVDKNGVDSQIDGVLTLHQVNNNFNWQIGLAGAVALTVVTGFLFTLWLGWQIAKEISYLIVLAIIFKVLKKKNSLRLKEIKFDTHFRKDLLVGTLILALPFIFGLSTFLVIPLIVLPLMGNLSLLIWVFFGLIQSFLPIYLANLLKNVFNWHTKFEFLIIFSYLSVLFLNIISLILSANPLGLVLSAIISVILFIFNAVSFGFVIRKIFHVVQKSL